MATKNSNSTAVIIILIVIIIGAIIAGIVLSNNNNANNGLTAADKAADKSQITSNWQTFFAYSTSLNERENLLQNGKQFASIIQGEFESLGSAKSTVKVNDVTINNASKATVDYSVYLNGQSALPNQSGTALKENGSWVVSDSTICGLLAMAGSKPSVCSNY